MSAVRSVTRRPFILAALLACFGATGWATRVGVAGEVRDAHYDWVEAGYDRRTNLSSIGPEPVPIGR